MPKSIFMTTMTAGTPDLPPAEADEGLQLNYLDDGVLAGGYSCVGQVPGDVGSILVQGNASDEALDAMAAGSDYIFIEDVVEAEEGPSESPMAPSLQPPIAGPPRMFNRGEALTFLLAHGHAAELATTFPGAVAEAVLMILDLHNISELQWQHAHG